MNIRELIASIPDAVGISYSSKATIGGGAVGIVSGMATLNWPAIIGSSVAILGLAANFYFHRRRLKLEEKEKELNEQMAKAENLRREQLHQAQIAKITKPRRRKACLTAEQ